MSLPWDWKGIIVFFEDFTLNSETKNHQNDQKRPFQNNS